MAIANKNFWVWFKANHRICKLFSTGNLKDCISLEENTLFKVIY
jgi:hypothetical protein